MKFGNTKLLIQSDGVKGETGSLTYIFMTLETDFQIFHQLSGQWWHGVSCQDVKEFESLAPCFSAV